MRAIVIAGGTIGDPAFYKEKIKADDLVICADRGYLNAAKIGVIPQCVIGDFDSSCREGVPGSACVITLPVEKDKTDLHECILYAIEKGAEEILLFGARGTRLDHSMAAISLIYMGLMQGVTIRLVDEHNEMFMFKGQVQIAKKEGYKLSLLPVTKVKGITTNGLYYSLSDAEMDWGNPYGVSNEFTEEMASVTICEGVMMVMLSRD